MKLLFAIGWLWTPGLAVAKEDQPQTVELIVNNDGAGQAALGDHDLQRAGLTMMFVHQKMI